MTKVINMVDGNTTEIEDVVQIPTSSTLPLNGSWDNENLDISERVELLSKEVERLETEAVLKMYPIHGGLNFGNEIKTFIEDKAKWRFTDALVVVSIHRELEVAVNQCRETQPAKQN